MGAAKSSAVHAFFRESTTPGFRDTGRDTGFFGRVLETYQAERLNKHYPVGHDKVQDLTKRVPRILHIDAKGTEQKLFTDRCRIREHRYPVIRFSHYFQDHSRYSYGIKLAPCSHHDGDPDSIKTLYNPPVKSCDLLIFNLKIVHSAKCLLRRDGQVLAPSEEDRLEITAPDEFFPAPATRNVIFWDFCTMARESELFIRNRAFSELDSWHTLAAPLDALPVIRRLATRGDMIVRHDTEIARLRALDIIGKLTHMDRARLDYLENITSSVITMSDDIERFGDEIKQAIKDSSL